MRGRKASKMRNLLLEIEVVNMSQHRPHVECLIFTSKDNRPAFENRTQRNLCTQMILCRMKFVSISRHHHLSHHLVVEESDVLFHERDAQLLCRLEHRAVVLAACRRSDVLGTASVRPEDIIDEWEECVRADCHTLHL